MGGKDWREGTAEHRAHAGGWRSDWGLAAHMEVFVITISVGKARLASVGLYLWGEGTAGEEGGGRGEAGGAREGVERDQARGPPLGRGAGERARVLDHGAVDRQSLCRTSRAVPEVAARGI